MLGINSGVDLVALLAASLLLAGPLAVLLRQKSWVSTLIYLLSAVLCLSIAVVGFGALSGILPASSLVLPLGLPWVGAHFELDMLAAFFLIILGLGGGVISIYAVGYGRGSADPMRVLAFYPPFLAAMTLVILAADAFSFLLSWEVMSLLSWALVLAHHKHAETQKAGYVYLLMAGFGTMALLLAFGL
ncbi:MAG: hydrogenase 4 subunit B, partial [Alphaproteobacteria bacterium]|nr:hydrogenase 4 subunit B [Alphaproteobacteria bacterium]